MKCEKCNKEHDGSYGSGRFCSSKCARSFSSNNNSGTKIVKCNSCDNKIEVDKRASAKNCKCDDCRKSKKYNGFKNSTCLFCGTKLIKGKQNKYCSNKCQSKHRWELRKSKIDSCGVENSSYIVKRYLIEKLGHKCSICGGEHWMNKPIPLILDHINGNPEDNRIVNFRLVCGNCDMQLPTYKNKNAGNGRAYRRQRYKDGKRY
tara:strand:+ start:17299 stop:17910 length:612 start_codon:yes stop_codon:yes gene_type:complete